MLLNRINEFLKNNVFRNKESLEIAKEYGFTNEILLLNYNRARYINYFTLALLTFLLYSDFFLTNLWDVKTIRIFRITDITFYIINILVFISSHYIPPFKTGKLLAFHKIGTNLFIASAVIWSVIVSAATETNTEASFYTYLVCVFIIYTAIYMSGGIALTFLIFSYILFVAILKELGNDFQTIFTNYMSLIGLIIVAWIISRVLYNNKKKSFIANKELEIAKNSLDIKVKERTQEITEKNIQLNKEINERKNYEKSLRYAKKSAEEADKLKTVFLANMSHEIRTPLNGIMGFSDLLKNDKLNSEKKNRYIEIINNNGQQLLKIIDDILDISLIESNQLKIDIIKFKLNNLIDDLFDFFETYKKTIDKQHIKLETEKFFKNGEDITMSDPSRVQQVLTNLIKNAFKFTKEGTIKFGYEIENNTLLFYVEDTGIGIANNIMGFIFERFRQGEESLKRSYGGTGLGLSISKGIITMLGGEIWIDKQKTNGSKFCFTLPYENILSSEESEEKNDLPDESEVEKIKDKTILIIEDDLTSYNYLEEILTPLISRIIRATDGQKAIEIFKNETIDLVLMDIHLPGLDGYAATKTLKKLKPHVPIIAQTANALKTDKTMALKAGCNDYVSKPINSNILIRKIVEFIK